MNLPWFHDKIQKSIFQRFNFRTEWRAGEKLHTTHLSNDFIESRWGKTVKKDSLALYIILIIIIFFPTFIPEGRRHGKTVIFAKNVASKRPENGTKIEDSDYDETDSDESMSDGHPSKKQKIS